MEVLVGRLYVIYGTANNCMQENASNPVFMDSSVCEHCSTTMCLLHVHVCV